MSEQSQLHLIAETLTDSYVLREEINEVYKSKAAVNDAIWALNTAEYTLNRNIEALERKIKEHYKADELDKARAAFRERNSRR